ncbi:MAG: transporter substrate-binding domain-containing protein [Lachnospiraceae bacterium]|nr:transporter substrate-binding domain-containing protein [Lachnospiraceae bacterium]
MKKKALGILLSMTMVLLSACAYLPAAAPASGEAEAAAPAAEKQESDLEYIKGKGTLIVGITNFEPMDYPDEDGNWIGFDAEVAEKVADSLGVECEFIEIDWDNKILELDNKSIDCVWNGMTLTDEVKKSMECTRAYCNNAQTVVMKAEAAADYPDADSMKELSFAVENGSAGEAAAEEAGFKITAMNAQADALMEVAAGTSDACVIDLLMAGAMIGEGTSYPDLTHTINLTSEEYGVGCRKGSDLAEYINGQFDAYAAGGSLEEIAKTYGVQDALIK